MELTGALVEVRESTHVAEARRRASYFSNLLGFDDVVTGQAAIAVTEAATNLLKHAGGGQLFVGIARGTTSGLQIVAMDRGRGIQDVPASLRDGVSTAGTSGNGLGAIRRAASSFDLYTQPGAGTVIAATMYAGRPETPDVAGVSIPAPGEVECGDAWAVWSAGALSSVFVCDGLGHGRDAAAAAQVAIATFLKHAERSVEDVMTAVHDALRSTRGAAIALAEMDRRRGVVNYCGLGNISAVLARPDGNEQHLVSLSGIAGHVARRLQKFTYPWTAGTLLIMHSDGLNTHWNLARYPGLTRRQPGVIAGVLARDQRRGPDDATVVVAAYNEER